METAQRNEPQLENLVELYETLRGDIRQVFSAWKLAPDAIQTDIPLENVRTYVRVKKALSILCGFDAIPHLYDQRTYESGIRYLVAALRL